MSLDVSSWKDMPIAVIGDLMLDVYMYGVIGEDTHGSLFKHLCTQHHIPVANYTIPDRPTTTKTRVVEQVHNDQVCRIDAERENPLDSTLATRLTDQIIQDLPR